MKWFKISIIFLIIFSIFSCKSPVSTDIFNNVDELAAHIKQDVNIISQKEFKKILDSGEIINLLDCREKEMYDSACIPGAVNIPRGVLEFDINNKIQEKRKPLYVYSDYEAKSILAACSLKLIKFSYVVVIEGDWNTWENTYPDYIQLEPNAGKADESSDQVEEEEGGCGG